MKLTLKQQRFADEYIISGNATQSAIKAGYSKKTAGVIGDENLKKPYIARYIQERLAEIKKARTMSIEEAIERTSSIARREPQKGYSKTINKLTGDVEKEVEYYFTPTVEEAQRSLEHIIKINGGFIDKVDLNADVDMELHVEVDYGD
ncbi:terminase small subunit [Eubacteriales bacterium KG125]